MSHVTPLLRLTPQAAGTLQQLHIKATHDLLALTRHTKEFDRQLKVLIGSDAVHQLHQETENALLLTDLVKEAA